MEPYEPYQSMKNEFSGFYGAIVQNKASAQIHNSWFKIDLFGQITNVLLVAYLFSRKTDCYV